MTQIPPAEAIAVHAVDPAGPDAARAVAVVRTVDPDEVIGAGDMARCASQEPRYGLLLATRDGMDAGAAELARIEDWNEPHGLWLWMWVLPGRHGDAGAALWAAVLAHCARHGATMLRAAVPEDQPDTIDLLTAGGLREMERSQRVRLPMGERPESPEPPAGIRLVRLAEDPGLLDGIVALDAETVQDIPGEGADAQGRAWWEDLLASGVFDHRTVVAAVADGGPVAYCGLRHHLDRPEVASVEYTATARAWRGRGLAMLVKRACHAAAWDAGIREIRAWNHLDNAPMRAVNERLGYRRATDVVMLRGDLPGGS